VTETPLPALLVAVPIVAAVLPPLLRTRARRVGWPVAVLALLVQTALAGTLAWTVTTGGTVSYVVGDLPAAIGVELVVDRLAVPFVLLVPVATLGGLAYGRRGGPRSATVHSLLLLLVAGLTGVCVTADAFNLYVFLEISGLAAYGLVASGTGGRAALSALRYLLVGTVGASLYLLGVAYAYVATGTLNLADMATQVAAVGHDATLVVASFALVAVGLGVKVALYPLHTWKPGAYADAPPAVAAVLSALVSTVAAYALARLLLFLYTVDLLAAVPAARTLLSAAAVLSVLAGSVLAFRQSDVRRLLAYSGVAQFGVAVAGLAVATGPAVAGAVVHLLGHALAKGGAFLAAGVLASGYGARTVEEYAGLARRAPVTAAGFAVLAVSLVGIPPAVGFFGKYYVALGAVEAGAWPVAAAVLLSTLLSLAYFARLLERLYVRSPPDPAAAGPSASGAAGRDGSPAADGGAPAASQTRAGGELPTAVTPGMVAPVAAAAVAVLALGLLAAGLVAYLTPVLSGVVA
jgi:multicomponent Na+:H+ antiporter subunit D